MTKTFKRKLVAGLFAPVLAIGAGVAMAQTTAPATTMTPSASGMSSWNAQTFDRMDKNRDGRISREEAEADAVMKGAWSKMDAANRGSISKDEFEKYRTMQPGATGAAGTSPPPNSGTATPSTTNPSTTPSSGGTVPK